MWPNTAVGATSTQPCPGGVDSVGQWLFLVHSLQLWNSHIITMSTCIYTFTGSATRICGDGGVWNNSNVLECQSLEILRVEMEV